MQDFSSCVFALSVCFTFVLGLNIYPRCSCGMYVCLTQTACLDYTYISALRLRYVCVSCADGVLGLHKTPLFLAAQFTSPKK